MRTSYLSVMGLLILGCNSNIDLGARDGGAPDSGEFGTGGSGAGGQTSNTAVCGDGKLGSNEPCDDSNATSGDGCSATCMIESGYVCPIPGQPCTVSQCGDGVVQAANGEQCDNGAAKNSGGYNTCSPACTFGPYCGDGTVDGPEECDDGTNAGDYGGCSPACKVGPHCGDGVVQLDHGEECDMGVANGTAETKCTLACKTILITTN